MIYTGSKEVYPGIGKIEFEGKNLKILLHSDGTTPMRWLPAGK